MEFIDRKEFGNRLSAFLKKAKVSQVTASQWVGVSQAAVSDWVRGIAFPPIDKAAILAARLGISLDHLVGLDESPPDSGQLSHAEKSAAEVAILLLRVGVDEAKRRLRLDDTTPPEPSTPIREIPPSGGKPFSREVP